MAHLVKYNNFIKLDPDIGCREVIEVLDVYHPGWFLDDSGREVSFELPTFFLKNGKAYFNNGRHRTTVLSRYLEIIPMAVTNNTMLDIESKSALRNISCGIIKREAFIELPDLPFLKINDENIDPNDMDDKYLVEFHLNLHNSK
jgi:hypothetical protein